MEKSYKDPKIYMKGLISLYKIVNTKMKEMRLRVFCDIHRYEEIKNQKWIHNKNVEIIVFDCPKFKQNGYHIGTFGTLIRFFPFKKASKTNP
jgi:hypothetical protein